MMVTKICPKCNKPSYVDIPKDAYEKWQMGMCIQNAWPDGSATDRETLISGICPKCQKETFEDEQG